jgi:hypothetical protein
MLVAATLALGGLTGAALPVAMAGAAATHTSLVGNGISVVVAKGWVAQKPQAGDELLTHPSPKAIIAIETGTGVTASPQSVAQTKFNSVAKAFLLKSLKITGTQTTAIPGNGKFDEVYSFTYTGKHQGTYGGLAAEFQNSKTGVACFAMSIAKVSDKSKLKGSINQIINSVGSN